MRRRELEAILTYFLIYLRIILSFQRIILERTSPTRTLPTKLYINFQSRPEEGLEPPLRTISNQEAILQVQGVFKRNPRSSLSFSLKEDHVEVLLEPQSNQAAA